MKETTKEYFLIGLIVLGVAVNIYVFLYLTWFLFQ